MTDETRCLPKKLSHIRRDMQKLSDGICQLRRGVGFFFFVLNKRVQMASNLRKGIIAWYADAEVVELMQLFINNNLGFED